MERETPPSLSETEVIAIAKRALQEHEWLYDVEFGLQPIWRGSNTSVLGKADAKIMLWSVNFLTPSGPFDQESRFLEINDKTGTALGVMTGHNYFTLE